MKKKDVVRKTIEELFDLLGIEGEFTLEETDDVINIVLETKDTGMVIGHHGDILESLQTILALCIAKKQGNFVRVSLEVGDYKKNRTGYLESLALSARERALSDQQEVPLPDLKSWERRIVHLMFQDDKEVMSESVGEGKDRILVIKPRTPHEEA